MTTCWAEESEESCILELSRRSSAACQWRATSFRRAIPSEEPFVGSKLQCFHNRMTGFADWAQLFRNEGTGAWYAVLHCQVDGGDVARRKFGKRFVVRLGELLDRYEEIRVNNGEKYGGASEKVEAIFEPAEQETTPVISSLWTQASGSACVAELQKRLGRKFSAGDEFKLLGQDSRAILEKSDNDTFIVRLSDTGNHCSLGEFLDLYPSIASSSSRSKNAIMKPPPKKLYVNLNQKAPNTEEDTDDRHAFELFIPVVPSSRTERSRLDSQAEEWAQEITQAARADGSINSPTICTTPTKQNYTKRKTKSSFEQNNSLKQKSISAPSLVAIGTREKIITNNTRPSKNAMNTLAKECARKASRPYFSGVSLRRPADALYDAILEQRKRQAWNATPAVSVAMTISRAALDDRTTAPGAVFDAIANEAISQGSKIAAADAVDLVAELSLAALFRYHPALFAHRDTAVATLEACDQALLGDDCEEDNDSGLSVLRESKKAQREKRYQAVLTAFLVANIDDDDDASSSEDLPQSIESDEQSIRNSAVDAFLVGDDFTQTTTKKSVATLRSLRIKRTARGKLRIMVQTLEHIATELAQAKSLASPQENKQNIASDDLMPALCDCIKESALPRSQLKAQLAFAKRFNRDPKLLLGADGYALTSFEIALAALDQAPQITTQVDTVSANNHISTPPTRDRRDNDSGNDDLSSSPLPPPTIATMQEGQPKPINPKSISGDRASAWASSYHHESNDDGHEENNSSVASYTTPPASSSSSS